MLYIINVHCNEIARMLQLGLHRPPRHASGNYLTTRFPSNAEQENIGMRLAARTLVQLEERASMERISNQEGNHWQLSIAAQHCSFVVPIQIRTGGSGAYLYGGLPAGVGLRNACSLSLFRFQSELPIRED
jgi:hypothetical protein